MERTWISVADKLPELHPHEDEGNVYVSDRVLLFVPYVPGELEEIVIGEYEKDICSFGIREGFTVDGCFEDRTTYWMPLPEPPKEG